ncbi:nucleotidyltransferase AbiEii toxin of type IV toxin-antitoxin system [Kribbella sp. VKM Ac-2527]|uniref:Nucleotidyltransferase AbiEii toxin of type IV toxin-antitoxin system n=1 Tax=Kribbella caucasensis TaxID=2512215 RepID=A0A4R6K6G5_9ACTN|nr:nucleotidyl transferase AbiEii/AbiGii toxin family protein [Kribbella sp. VKM Ac-2527]TDO45079.1 nucleotidyltransferase AbiEii toxin of type IV toxin-antitoxin system [Kribbella sp. VKM Ac-2527]
MNPLQTRMATVGLRILADDRFVLAGGYALRAHGFGDRDSDDIDLFTDLLDAERFARRSSAWSAPTAMMVWRPKWPGRHRRSPE